jgi:hypothetical protein
MRLTDLIDRAVARDEERHVDDADAPADARRGPDEDEGSVRK